MGARGPMQTQPSSPVVINGNQVLAWVLGIIVWVLICSGAWFVATRDDYAKLAEASVCYDTNGHSHSTVRQCANINRSDAHFYKSEIDRKARISRLRLSIWRSDGSYYHYRDPQKEAQHTRLNPSGMVARYEKRKCQSASKFDPRSASNFDPFWRRVLAVALAPSELVGVAETARARVVV